MPGDEPATYVLSRDGKGASGGAGLGVMADVRRSVEPIGVKVELELG